MRFEEDSVPKKPTPIWSKGRPADLDKPAKLAPGKKASAKAAAKSAGRTYPNLIDNMRAARGK